MNRTFGRALCSNHLLVGIGARDALEARLIEESGFDFVWTSSLGVSASFALPDTDSLSEACIIQRASEMASVVTIPVIADSLAGYGDISVVRESVRKLETMGVAGLSLEDKVGSKTNSLRSDHLQGLRDPVEFSNILDAAIQTRSTEHFVIIARVEALVAGASIQETIDRANKYADAGATAVIIHSRSNVPDEIMSVVQAWHRDVPLALIPTTYPTLTEQELSHWPQVRIVIYANQLLRAGIKAQIETLREIREVKGIHTIDARLISLNELFEIPISRRGTG